MVCDRRGFAMNSRNIKAREETLYFYKLMNV
jgi:hypothetical protein